MRPTDAPASAGWIFFIDPGDSYAEPRPQHPTDAAPSPDVRQPWPAIQGRRRTERTAGLLAVRWRSSPSSRRSSCGAAAVAAAMIPVHQIIAGGRRSAGCRRRPTEPGPGSGRVPATVSVAAAAASVGPSLVARSRYHSDLAAGSEFARARPRPARQLDGRVRTGPANGDGANIVIPLVRLDGRVIKPGATFEFWTRVGEVSRRSATGAARSSSVIRVDPTAPSPVGSAPSRRRCSTRPRAPDSRSCDGRATVATSGSTRWAWTPRSRRETASANHGVPQRHHRADRHPHRQHAGQRESRPVRAEPARRTSRSASPRSAGHQNAHDRHVRMTSLPAANIGASSPERRDDRHRHADRARRDGHLPRRDRWVSIYRSLEGLVLDGTG